MSTPSSRCSPGTPGSRCRRVRLGTAAVSRSPPLSAATSLPSAPGGVWFRPRQTARSRCLPLGRTGRRLHAGRSARPHAARERDRRDHGLPQPRGIPQLQSPRFDRPLTTANPRLNYVKSLSPGPFPGGRTYGGRVPVEEVLENRLLPVTQVQFSPRRGLELL